MRINHNRRSLAGRWKFATDPDGKGDFQEPDASIESWQRPVTFFDLEHDDTAWDKIAVPACWQTEGHRYNGVAWYRTRFDYAPDGANNVIRLLFKGVDYFADVWLNGYYLGSHEGFFHRFSFDASRWIRPGENLLVVKVDAPNLKRVLMKGALQGINWDCNDPTLDPGGIWNDVQLLASRDLYVEDLKVTPFIDLEGSSARVLCRATLCNTTPDIKKVFVTAALSPHNFAGEPHAASTPVVLPPGVSQADLWLGLDEPRLVVAVGHGGAEPVRRCRFGDRRGGRARPARRPHRPAPPAQGASERLGDLPERQADRSSAAAPTMCRSSCSPP